MGIRSPFTFDHVSRILRFKGFQNLFMRVKFLIIPLLILIGVLFVLMSLELINYGYYSAIDEAMASIIGVSYD